MDKKKTTTARWSTHFTTRWPRCDIQLVLRTRWISLRSAQLVVKYVDHRAVVVFSYDHDLTKTRLVQIALGLLWHWPGDRTADESQLTDVAMDAIRAGHLEVENHHPEFESVNADRVDVHKLLTDRVCVHLQKDPKDTKKGWDVNLNFIPTIYREEWFRFAEQHKDICLYAALEQARAVAKIDFVNNRRMRSRTRRASTIHCCRWCQQRVWASSGLMGSLGIAPSLDIW